MRLPDSQLGGHSLGEEQLSAANPFPERRERPHVLSSVRQLRGFPAASQAEAAAAIPIRPLCHLLSRCSPVKRRWYLLRPRYAQSRCPRQGDHYTRFLAL